MLATTSLGAIWSSCSPDFGLNGVVDRFGQIEPKILFAVNGYYYNGKTCDTRPTIEGVVSAIDSIRRTVVIPFASDLGTDVSLTNAIDWHDFTSCIHRGRRARQNALCMGTVARCCST
jgi:acetoacetyl-CoA synthetase